jgi:CheY-like chemotaxis protein
MTLSNLPVPTPGPRTIPAPGWHPRTEVELLQQQLHAIESFNRARHVREAAAAAGARSRELRLDLARTMGVLRREHTALVGRAHAQLQASARLLGMTAERRVVLAHRNDWFVRTLTGALAGHGVLVVASTDNGAEAVGLSIAEQPDLILVQDTLLMLPGNEVIAEVRRFSPDTLVVAQAGHGDRVEQLLNAGASTVILRQAPPRDLALSLLRLLVPA